MKQLVKKYIYYFYRLFLGRRYFYCDDDDEMIRTIGYFDRKNVMVIVKQKILKR
jgi:hypothetical protein